MEPELQVVGPAFIRLPLNGFLWAIEFTSELAVGLFLLSARLLLLLLLLVLLMLSLGLVNGNEVARDS